MTFLTDVWHALRSLQRARGFAVTAILTLGLGIALCTTAFIIANVYLIQNLPYPEADRLYSVRYGRPGEEPRQMEALDWDSLGDVIEHPIAWDLDVFYLLGGDHAEVFPGAWVTPGFMEGLGIRPAVGHGFGPEAFLPGSANVVLISHRLWVSRFAGDLNIVGRTFTAYVSDRPEEAETFAIAGVLPAGFWHINVYTDVIAPLRAPTHPYMVRLKRAVTPEEAGARMSALVRSGGDTLPEGWRVELISAHGAYVASVRPMLGAVSVAAALVLLVACANVAGLLLVRGRRRQSELAIRVALGAGRGALVRLLFAEALVLAAASTALALFATDLALGTLAPFIQQQLGRRAPQGASALAVDGYAIGAAAGFGLLTACICALASLPGAFRSGLGGTHGSRTTTEGRGSRRIRAGLIALEVAASLALLTGSMLMVRSVIGLLRVDLGFNAERVAHASVTLRQNRYPDAEARVAVFNRMVSRLGEVPGAESVALTTAWPVQQPRQYQVSVAGAGGPLSTRVAVHGVTSEYFTTFGTPITAGRAFVRTDTGGSEPVAIVSESLARRLWPDGGAPGSRISVPQEGSDGEPVQVARVVVGIAADVRQGPADEDLADLYVPLLQAPGRFAFILMRTSGAPSGLAGPVRAAFRDVDPELAVVSVAALQTTVDQLTAQPRFLAALLAGFGLASGLLALVGVYGVIAYSVRQREREIAVRIAVGADPARLTRLFVAQGSLTLGAGLLLGVAGAVVTGGLIEHQLFGVTARDPVSIAGAAAAFALAGLLAIWWPSRRAARTDPAIALRAE